MERWINHDVDSTGTRGTNPTTTFNPSDSRNQPYDDVQPYDHVQQPLPDHVTQAAEWGGGHNSSCLWCLVQSYHVLVVIMLTATRNRMRRCPSPRDAVCHAPRVYRPSDKILSTPKQRYHLGTSYITRPEVTPPGDNCYKHTGVLYTPGGVIYTPSYTVVYSVTWPISLVGSACDIREVCRLGHPELRLTNPPKNRKGAQSATKVTLAPASTHQ